MQFIYHEPRAKLSLLLASHITNRDHVEVMHKVNAIDFFFFLNINLFLNLFLYSLFLFLFIF